MYLCFHFRRVSASMRPSAFLPMFPVLFCLCRILLPLRYTMLNCPRLERCLVASHFTALSAIIFALLAAYRFLQMQWPSSLLCYRLLTASGCRWNGQRRKVARSKQNCHNPSEGTRVFTVVTTNRSIFWTFRRNMFLVYSASKNKWETGTRFFGQ
jgi:hypothetical protein